MADYATARVEVDGGSVEVGTWAGDGTPVLALHGITAHHLCWPLLGDALPQPLVAPDLRGRGRSGGLPGPWGMAAHADDAAAVIRTTADQPVIVVGHSMGGFVAAVLAHRHPDLVRHLILVDGGLPFAPAELGTTQAALAAIRARLETRWPDAATYVDFFRQHPAFARDWSPTAQGYAEYDAVGTPPRVHSSAEIEAVVADQSDITDGSALPDALAALPERVTFLHAPRGFADDPPGLYAPETVAALSERFPQLDVRAVPDVNHYTIVLSQRGTDAIAAAVADAGG